MDLGLNQVNIAESFTQLDLLKNFTCRNYKWKIELYHKIGNLNESMSPDLKTLTGDLLGQFIYDSQCNQLYFTNSFR
jgi:hypothetical protein